MRITDAIKNSVVFLGLQSEKDEELPDFRATGFFVGVPARDDGSGLGPGFPYLVTAKHVAERLGGRDFVVRANTKDGLSRLVKSSPLYPVRWYSHPTDQNADVAVFEWGTSREDDDDDIDYKVVPVGTFLSDKHMSNTGVGIGDEVYTVGLFTFHKGTLKNHPLLRVGHIAMFPDEKVLTRDGEMDAYLIEARSIGGVSGSPVFVSKPRLSRKMLLVGLIHGHWELPEATINDPATPPQGNLINAGISIVTPAQKIRDVLYCAELSERRASRLREEHKPE